MFSLLSFNLGGEAIYVIDNRVFDSSTLMLLISAPGLASATGQVSAGSSGYGGGVAA